ncbi:hypothetical protein EV127DRAFT_428662 [Xylaria flabelliformis]|nr:hypothetical protein EV127DRAFT_428662 [Xylaria flabelliformis]
MERTKVFLTVSCYLAAANYLCVLFISSISLASQIAGQGIAGDLYDPYDWRQGPMVLYFLFTAAILQVRISHPRDRSGLSRNCRWRLFLA